MEVIVMKLADLVKPEKNVRMHTEQQLKEFERSVKMFGQIRPIVVDENNVILAGVGLYECLVRMGYKEVSVYKIMDLTVAQKKKLMVADNKIFNLGVDDLETLNEFFNDLKDDLDIPGFDEDILKEMIADAEEVTETISSYGLLDNEEIQKIKEIGQKREEKAQIQSEAQKNTESNNNYSEVANTPSEENQELERPYIICPNCGEKIWQ